jgi:hypothetical protein
MLVAKGCGKRFRFVQVDKDLSMLSEHKEGIVQVEPQIDGLLLGLAHGREMLEGDQRLLKVCHCLPRRRACKRLHASLTAVGNGLPPYLTPERMVGEPFDLLGQSVGKDRLEGRDNPGMQGTPTLLEQTPVGHFVCEGVLEGEFRLGKQARLIEKLGCLQVGQATMQRLFRHIDNDLQ